MNGSLMRNLGALSLLLAASACTGSIDGDDGGGTSPPRNDVRVQVKDGYSPVAAVRVIFQDAADAVIADTATDAQGLASAEMTAGSVTVIRTFPVVTPPPPEGQRAPEVYTYVGVKNGDLLTLGDPTSTKAPGAIVVKVPETAEGTVKVVTPCGSGQGTAPNIAITVNDCPTMMGFLVTDQQQSSFFQEAPYAENVDLSLGMLSGDLAATLSATNVPPNSSVNAEERVVTGLFTLYRSGEKRIDQAPQTVNLPNLTGVDQLLVTRISTQGMGTQIVSARDTYSGSPALIDASADLIPYITGNVQYAPTGVSWMETGSGTADAVYVALNVTRNVATPTVDNTYTRLIIAPHAGTSLRMPLLPDALYNPTSADQIGGATGLLRATGGYDMLRAKAFAVDSIGDIAPVGGKLVLSYAGGTPPGR